MKALSQFGLFMLEYKLLFTFFALLQVNGQVRKMCFKVFFFLL